MVDMEDTVDIVAMVMVDATTVKLNLICCKSIGFDLDLLFN